jgi:hypothetical protein
LDNRLENNLRVILVRLWFLFKGRKSRMKCWGFLCRNRKESMHTRVMEHKNTVCFSKT